MPGLGTEEKWTKGKTILITQPLKESIKIHPTQQVTERSLIISQAGAEEISEKEQRFSCPI